MAGRDGTILKREGAGRWRQSFLNVVRLLEACDAKHKHDARTL